MGIFTNWFKRYSQPLKTHQKPRKRKQARESTLTASSGGMGSTELLIRLEMVLGDIKSKKPIIKHAYEIAPLSHSLQSRLLADLAELSDISHRHSYELLSVSAMALTSMEQPQYDKWLYDIKSLLNDGYDEAASKLIQKHSSYKEASNVVNLSSITETLEKLVFSIHEKEIPILAATLATNTAAYTDGQQLFLPTKISHFDNYEDNYRLYKVLTFQLLEQMQSNLRQSLDTLKAGIEKHGDNYLKLFSGIETLRIDKTIKTTFPGIWRDIEYLNKETAITYPKEFLSNTELVTIEDSLRLSNQLIDKPPVLPELIYQPQFVPNKISDSGQAIPQSQSMNENEIENQIENKENSKTEPTTDTQLTEQIPAENQLEPLDQSSDQSNDDQYQNWQDPIPTPKDEQQEKLDAKKRRERKGYYYKEWDTSLQKYRKDWCYIEEVAAENTIEDNVLEQDVALKYAECRIKKILDLLINDQKSIRFQSDGDDIDIDAWVSARSNRSKNADDYQNLYIRNNKNTRNVAIMFAVDISGSTRGWKNTAIKQSTSVLCKTMARLDDQYAVYAFSGSGRNDCHIYPVKTFAETYSKTVQSRIFAMQPQQYTRMGAAIRHLSAVLSKTTAKTRILFVLTDGKPDDIDSYRGQYAIEDTRRALNEARAFSLNPFVLTFDKDGMNYLPHMLGSNRYQLISDVSQLPVQISAIYKHLTT